MNDNLEDNPDETRQTIRTTMIRKVHKKQQKCPPICPQFRGSFFGISKIMLDVKNLQLKYWFIYIPGHHNFVKNILKDPEPVFKCS